MKIGIIGESENVSEILKESYNFSYSGYYISNNKNPEPELPRKVQKYTSAEVLISDSDILYINENPEAFEIAKQAIKTSTHIFFESPFIFSENKFNELFDLAHETNVLLKFNQKILQKNVYKKINGNAEPDLIKIRIDSAGETAKNNFARQEIFEFATILRDNIKSGIRKINTYKDERTNKYFSLNIQLDNDSHCELLFNSIAHTGSFFLEFFYPNKVIHVDFTENKIKSTNHKTTSTKDTSQKQNLTKKELNDFITNLPKLTTMPITIREENQYLLYFTYRLLEKVFPPEG